MKFNKKQKQINFRVGIFIIISLVILILGYLWFTNHLEKGSFTKLTIAFPDAIGLEIGDGVLIMGVNRGKVTSIDLAENKVLVSIAVKLQHPLMIGTSFYIGNTSLMGSTRIIVKPGNGNQPLDTSRILSGKTNPGINSLTSKAGNLISELNQFLSDLNRPDNVLAKYSLVADSLSVTLSNINNLISANQTNLTSTISDLADASNIIADLLQQNKSSIDSTFADSNLLVSNLNQTINSIRQLSSELNDVARQMKTKDSSFTKLTTDDELYKKLKKTTARLDSLISDIKKNPKKYLSLKIF